MIRVAREDSLGSLDLKPAPDGNWRRIVFRDPLSDQLSHAWVYKSAVTPLAGPLDECK